MTRSERLTLIATILGSTIVFLDSTVVNVALPAIQDDLDTGLAGQQWVVEAYMLTLVAGLLVGGSLGDLYGRRRMFVAGLVGFAVTSILCAVAPSEETLIGARALQGVTGALLVPGSLAIIAATFEGERRGRAIGLWTAWTGVSILIGPAGGGLLVELDWRWIFWVNLPLIALTVWLARGAITESSDPEACPGIDVPGIVLSAVGLAGPVFALIEQPTRGWSDPLVIMPLIAGVVCFAAFLLWEARARAPMLPLVLFRSHNFSVVNAATLFVYGGLTGATFFLTLFLQQVAGYSPFEAGAATTPITVLMLALSGRFGELASRIGPRLPMGVGPLLGAAGLLWISRLDSDPSYLADLLPALILFGIGLAMTVAPLTTTVLDAVAERRAGIASGVNNAVSRVAGLFAIAAVGAVISAGFASTLDERVGADSLSASERAQIEEAKAQPLSGDGDADIVAASEAGFGSGMLVAAALMALGGVISLIGVRNPSAAPEPHPGPGPAATAGECGRKPMTATEAEPVRVASGG